MCEGGNGLNDSTFNTFNTYLADEAAGPVVTEFLLSIRGLPIVGNYWSAYSWINYHLGAWIQAHADNYNLDAVRISIWYPLTPGGAALHYAT